MKILFLTSSLNAGGAERVATTLCNAWSARGHTVTLVPTFSGGGQPFYEISSAVELVPLADLVGSTQKGVRSSVRRLFALRRLIASRRPDVMISFLPNVNVATIISSAFMGIPRIVCERSDPSARSQMAPWEVACRLTYRYADMLTVQTSAVAAKVRRLYPGVARVGVIPNPLPDGIASSRVPRDSGRQVLLSMGRLSEEKQVGHLIDAFNSIAPGCPDWDLHIYGDGPLRSTLESQAQQLGWQERIMFKGSTREPWKVMAGADAFVMASRYEGFPNALLEAMAAGLPCVATDCPSGPREITVNGTDALLVPPDNHAALCTALSDLMRNAPLRAMLSERGRASVTGRFSLNAVLAIWDQFFDQVLASAAHHPDGATQEGDVI